MESTKSTISEKQIEDLCEVLSICLRKHGNEGFSEIRFAIAGLKREIHQLNNDVGISGNRILEMLVRGKTTPSMTGIGDPPRAKVIDSLRGFLGDARKITICDPYFFYTGKKSTDDALADLVNVLPRNFELLELFVLPAKESATDNRAASGNAELAYKFSQHIRKENQKVNLYTTDMIHDRIWIRRDGRNSKACLVGTSLNGLGNRIAFILGLPKRDLEEFESELSQIKHSQAPLPNIVAR